MKPKHLQTPLERCRAVASAFEESQLALWSSMWPMGHCAVTSLLLCPLLRCADESGGWRVHVGIVATTGRRYWRSEHDWERPEPFCHAWCESSSGDVVDATYGQFDGCEAMVALSAREAGDLGHYTSLRMTLDEEEAARRTISPSLSRDGWTAGSSVKLFFGLLKHGW